MALITANWRRSDGAGLAAAFDTERIRRTSRPAQSDGIEGQITGARHRIIHEACGHELTIGGVDCPFVQCLPDALRNATMDLPLDNHWIDDGAEIVDGAPSIDARDAGLRINLDFADMNASREGEVCRIPERSFLQARLELLAGELVRNIGL